MTSSKPEPPRLTLIAAMAENRVIGRNGDLPWRLPADLRHFKALTLGKPIVMGRRTWESLPGLLPERRHIVITSQAGYRAEGGEVVHSLAQAIEVARPAPEVMVIGGGEIYRLALPLAQRLELTLVAATVAGDTWFPEVDPAQWCETARETHAADEKNPFPYAFVTLERCPAAQK